MLISNNDKKLPIPSSPPKVHVREVKKDEQSASDDSDLENQDRDNMPASAKGPWWKRYAGYRKLRRPTGGPRKIRVRLVFLASITLVAVAVVLLWLYATGRLGNGPFQVKETINVQLAQGVYIGEVNPRSDKSPRAIDAFRGIPYAQSTGGNNRFLAPQPLVNKPDTKFSATDFGFACPQGGNRDQDEDCLNLNLYRPHYGEDDDFLEEEDMGKLGADRAMPVVIYVHGGGFNGGSGKERNMASFVAYADTPIIGINFNYRLGALGFLSGALAAKEGVTNLGLKDQQMLFSWVQKNVASFGGDPTNVTIVGLSAGAHSVGHHLISYAPANKLTSDPVPFHRAIIESGGSTARSVFASAHPLYESQFQEFLVKCGLDKTPENDVLTQLRALPLTTLVGASRSVWMKYYNSLRWPFQPVIDGPGGVIPDLPSRSWEKGNVLRIPIITGFDTNEGTIFVPSRANSSSALRDLMSPLLPALNETDIKTMEDLYPDPDTPTGKDMYITNSPAGFGKQFWRLDDAYAHYAYICPVLQTGHYASFTSAPVYVYQYAARSGGHGGADHGDEAPIVAHDMSVIANMPGLIDTANAMTGAWSRFAAFGDPNPSSSSSQGTFTWKPFYSPFTNSTGASAGNGAAKGQIATFGSGNDERVGLSGRQSQGTAAQMREATQRELDECKFWWDRILLSEGFGNGSVVIMKRDMQGRARL